MPRDTSADSIEKALGSDLKDILKDEFGTGIPQIATLVFVVLGSFQLQDKFNAGAWTIVAAICFFFVFMFRRHISSHLPRTGVAVLLFVALATSATWYIYSVSSSKAFDEWLRSHPIPLSAYFSFVTTTGLACLVVSYRKQEKLGEAGYPDIIEKALAQQLRSSKFYKKNIVFAIVVSKVDSESVYFETELSYDVVNRSDDSQEWHAEYLLNNKDGMFREVVIDGNQYSTDDRKYRRGSSVMVPIFIKGKGKASVRIRVSDKFRLNDSDIFTSYHPATDLTVTFTNETPNLKVFFDNLHIPDYPTKLEGKLSSLKIPDGILPFQGVRVRWEA
jgi:hypothetical protein